MNIDQHQSQSACKTSSVNDLDYFYSKFTSKIIGRLIWLHTERNNKGKEKQKYV